MKCDRKDCSNIALYQYSVCGPHTRNKFADKNVDVATRTNDDEVLKIIEEKVAPLANAGINFYIGRTCDKINRKSSHITVAKKQDKDTAHIVVESLMKVQGFNAANEDKCSFIFNCAFHQNAKVRENLTNRFGGGGHQTNPNDVLMYDIYIRYDAMSTDFST